jgi:hypothetical protein
MILGFSTQINGQPTYFVEKIHVGLRIENKVGVCEDHYSKDYNFIVKRNCKAKIHTIREDKNDRWQPGTKIDFFINCRQKDMLRFAPVLPVVSVQEVKIKWFNIYGEYVARVFIDGKSFAYVKFKNDRIVTLEGKMLELANNDGFDTIEDFFAYFNTDFKGKLIHWTDLKY